MRILPTLYMSTVEWASGNNVEDTMRRQNVSRRPASFVVTLVLFVASLTASRADPQDERLASLDIQLSEVGIFGAASTYDPFTTNGPEGIETASGELYDSEGWAAAIQIDLRGVFGGIHYGRNYSPSFALVECGNKRAIVRINDVGPLVQGRIIDLNARTMRFFDPTMTVGIVQNVVVTPLPGDDWIAGPLGHMDRTLVLSARSR